MHNNNLSPEIRLQLIEVLKDSIMSDLPVEKIEAETIISLGVDSLTLLNVSHEFENKYELKLDLDSLHSGMTVGELLNSLISTEG